MNDTSVDLHATWVLWVGLAVVASAWIRPLLKPTGVPALVGFLLLGIFLSVAGPLVLQPLLRRYPQT